MGTKEAQGFEEDLDTPEYHDAAEEPIRKEETDASQPKLRSMGFQGGYGSSSLKECIELLNATSNHTPAPLDSGVGQESIDPPQVMSPNMEGPSTKADAPPSNGSISQNVSQVIQPSSGSTSQCAPQVKAESQSQVKRDPTIEAKPESSSSTREAKAEQEESKGKEENIASVKQEERAPEPDSEDSFTPERVVEAVQRLLDTRESRASAYVQPDEGGESTPSQAASRERMFVSEATREQRYGPYCCARGKTCERKK